MHIFVTGASGFVGSAVARQLSEAGHRVTGLARTDAAASRLAEAGITPLRGDLRDLAGLAAAAKAADAVVHTAFIHDFANFAESIAVESRVITALGTALRGSGRPFLMTSGTGLLPPGSDASEREAATTEGHGALRGATEALALGYAEEGVRVGVVRLPPSVHGDGDHGFVPMLIEIARRTGISAYVEDGENRWPAVYREDAATVYRLALDHGMPMPRYHAVAEAGIRFREIAEVIGRKLGVPARSISRDDAAGHFGWLATFAGRDVPGSSRLTRECLGWEPHGPSLLADLEHGTYFETARG